MDLMQTIAVAGIIITNVVTIITLHIHLDNKTDSQLKITNELIRSIHEEMKDFHGRLCAIEERNKRG